MYIYYVNQLYSIILHIIYIHCRNCVSYVYIVATVKYSIDVRCNYAQDAKYELYRQIDTALTKQSRYVKGLRI